MSATVPYKGKISAVAPDGRSAIVELDEETEGRLLAVISVDSEGMARLMNGKGGIMTGIYVEGQARLGPDALVASSVIRSRETAMAL